MDQLIAALLMAVAGLLAAHWFPIGRGKLHPIYNYVTRVSVVGVSLTWYWETSRTFELWHYWLFCAVGGLGVIIGHAVDWWAMRDDRKKAMRILDAALED
ncbi:MAG: hypothetical protein M5U01_09415 [Ardenticatenaceae bacterium]|nr:hypothetical protein [Ardenticatenaceae bacterium]